MQHAEGKAGHNRKNIVGSFIPLIMTIVGEHIASKNLPPHFLGAFDAEKMSFLHYNAVLEAGFASVADLVSYDANGRISSISNAEAVVEYTYMPDGLDA